MENKPRSLAVSLSPVGRPRVILTGLWLQQFGFMIGDQVIIENSKPGELIIKVETPAEIMNELKRKRKLELQREKAENDLKKLAKFPHLRHMSSANL